MHSIEAFSPSLGKRVVGKTCGKFGNIRGLRSCPNVERTSNCVPSLV
jgi:hypothetical protein